MISPLFRQQLGQTLRSSPPVCPTFKRNRRCLCKTMNKNVFLILAALPFILTSCATPQPPVAFHKTDNTMLVIESLDGRTCQMLQPTASAKEENDKLLGQA